MTLEKATQKQNFSFAGCGFLGIYHMGVAVCLKKHVPHLLQNVSGTSAGALVACYLAADVSLSDAIVLWKKSCVKMSNNVFGILSPNSGATQNVRNCLEQLLPVDAHLRASGKLHLSLTRTRDFANVVASQYESRQELIDAVICATTIPPFDGLSRWYRGEKYVDGGFTNNLIIYDEHTVTVNPFCGGADICPKDDAGLLPWLISFNGTTADMTYDNLKRVRKAIFPQRSEELAQLCHQGYQDALRYLVETELVTCQDFCGSKSLTDCEVEAENILVQTKIDAQQECGKCENMHGNGSFPDLLKELLLKELHNEFVKRNHFQKIILVAARSVFMTLDIALGICRRLYVQTM